MADDSNPAPVSAGGGSPISRLAPGDIAARTFGRARNGVSESEVRDFLQRIAGEIVTTREYERELEDRVAQLEDQVRLAAAADPAGEVAAAEARAFEILREAEEAAREQGRAMVNEARAVRKRMLDDAEQRRGAIEAELEALKELRAELRSARDALRDTLAMLASTRTPARDTAPEPGEADSGAPETEPPAAATPGPAPVEEVVVEEVVVEEVVVDEVAVDEIAVDDEPEADVDPTARIESVFARLRGDATEAPVVVEPPAPVATEPVAPSAPVEPEPVEPAVGDAPAGPADDDFAARRRARDDVLEPATAGLMRRAKRILQDDQNEFLDAMRRQKSRLDPKKLLPGLELQTAVWAEVVAPSVEDVYRAGRETVAPATKGGAPKRLVSDLAEGLVVPLRERLLATVAGVIDDGPYEPVGELHRVLGAAVGARYREWRSQDLEPLVGDLLAAAYARGAFDAAPVGARLRWVPAEVAQCPDADDNALEATVKGQPFPTGQPCPPAHPGCRCMVALADES